jgi:murein hydrolase activator
MGKLLLLIISILFSIPTCLAQPPSQSRVDLENQRALIQKDIDDVKSSLDITHKNRKQTLGQLALLQKRLHLRQAAISNINLQVNFIQADMNNFWQEILKLKKELNTLRRQYAESTIYAYENRSNYDYLNFIFAACNFNDAIKRVEYLKAYRSYREQRAENIIKAEALLENKMEGLKVKRVEKDDALIKQNEEKQALEIEKKEKDEAVEQLQKHEKELKKEMIVKQRQDLKLTNAITAAIRRAREDDIEEAKVKTSAIGSLSEANTAHLKTEPSNLLTIKSKGKSVTKNIGSPTADIILSGNFEKDRGHLPWPISSGTISIRFGPHEVIKGLIHNSVGVTIESSPGASVTSVFDGYVQSVFSVEDMTVVMVRHGKYFTTYSNLSEASVSKGQTVKLGQVLGKLSESGQLDFVISDEKYQNFDPEKWLKK